MARAHTAALILAVGSAFGLAPHAPAQQEKAPAADTQAAPRPAGASRIDRYAKVLNLDAAQKDAAKDLYDAYTKQQQDEGKKLRDAMHDAQDDMNAGDRSAFEKKLGETMAAHREKTARQTETFLSDLKALLKPEQTANWPRLERYRRREMYLTSLVQIGGSSVGGSNVDLVTLIDRLGVPASIRPKIDEALAAYELEIDRPLQDRARNTEDEQKNLGAVQTFTPETFQKKLDRDRAVDLTIREVNSTYLRRIAALLPEDLARKLEDTYQARAFRSIYKDSAVSRKMAAAQKLADLSPDQKTQLQALLDKYKRDAKAANDRWAAAQQKAETDGRPTRGGLIMFTPGDSGPREKIDPDVAAARQARRDLDAQAREQMEKLLTPDQLAAIPAPTPGPNMGHKVQVFGDGTGDDMVFTSDVEMPDDVEPGPGGGGMVIIRTIEGGPMHAQPSEKPKTP